MILNTNINNTRKLQKQKKKNNFSILICFKSRIKFKENTNSFLIKLNNNISLSFQKKRTVYTKINDNKLFFFSNNLGELNRFTKKLLPFCSFVSFL